jgi:hypothetical protein
MVTTRPDEGSGRASIPSRRRPSTAFDESPREHAAWLAGYLAGLAAAERLLHRTIDLN